MAKQLYPPYINGTIPAFYCSTQGADITVPFSMNKAVAFSEVAGFALKIKEINGDVKTVLQQMTKSFDVSNTSVTFSTNESFLPGQYYKVQLAYIDKDGVIGYYSTVGIIKCTTAPTIEIKGLTFGIINTHNYSYTGIYSQYGGDITEKMYSYRFILYDSNNNILADSGEKLHNTSFDDVPYESHEEFKINIELDLQQSYYIQFIVTTTNLLTVRTPRYRIVQRRSIAPDVKLNLVAGPNFNNGYIMLSFHDEVDSVISGNFLISRASSKNNYRWEEIKRFDLYSIPPKTWSYKDYTVEQGVTYKYSFQQYNAQGIYSERIISNTITMDFEDMFLYDGKRQLRIRYNPKVSSYKINILEQKTDTIGSKYPYFSRNGNVNYKEFAISGLISYLSDENENFITMDKLGLDGFSNIKEVYGKYRTTNLLDYNIAAERFFKNEVLEWLNDGQIKLFKSPAEGNYLVRLMNISMTPTDSLSRMLHTFSATAYEVAECTDDNLAYYGMINPQEDLNLQTRWITVELKKLVDNYLQNNNITLEEAIRNKTSIEILSHNAIYLDCKDMTPGSHIQIKFNYVNNEDIQIGMTGAYHIEVNDNTNAIQSIKYVIDNINAGQITYGYEAKAITVFNLINQIELTDVPLQQFIGKEYSQDAHIWNSNLTLEGGGYEPSTNNLFDYLNDVRTTVLNVLFVRAFKRPVETLFVNTTNAENISLDNIFNYTLYTDIYCGEREHSEIFDLNNANPWTIYRIRTKAQTAPYDVIKNYRYYVDANLDEFSQLTDICIDGNTKQTFLYHDDMFSFTINEENIDLKDIEKYSIEHNDVSIGKITFNDGIILEVSYSKQNKIFNIEEPQYSQKYTDLHNWKNAYENGLRIISDDRRNKRASSVSINTIQTSYRNYLYYLNQALDQYRKENGLAI